MLLSRSEIENLKGGASCFYYKIPGENLGIKFYEDKHERNYSLQMQEICYHAGLAPKTGKIVDHAGFYGFETEHVLTLKEKFEDVDKVPARLIDKLDDLADEIFTVSGHTLDYNWLNFGLIGKYLVCIDFGYHDHTYYDSHILERA